MYIMIGGAGLVGKSLAKELVPMKHDVVVIDTDVKACEEIYAKYGAVTIHGNVTDLGTLESAGIKRCDIAVATMRNDSDNLAFSLLAKYHKAPQIIVRMMDPRFENIYKTVGVTNIARGLDFVIKQILINIETPELRGVITMGDIEMCIYNIPENATCSNKRSEIHNMPIFITTTKSPKLKIINGPNSNFRTGFSKKLIKPITTAAIVSSL